MQNIHGGAPPNHLEILFNGFGYHTFKPLQWNVIHNLVDEKRDVCAVMATAYGKSLCFQYPSVYLGGVTIVISPLISVMEDQIRSLTMRNIPACLLGSSQESCVQVYEDIFNNFYSIIYMTPEYCCCEMGVDLLRQMSVTLTVDLIAIDEAHCISSWGKNFRPDFRRLSFLHRLFPEVPFLAITAVATLRVCYDIVNTLNMRNPFVVMSRLNRPNLYFEVYERSYRAFSDLSKAMIKENGVWKFTGPTIIYCQRVKDTEEIAEILTERGINCLSYHAKMPLTKRKEAQNKFMTDEIDAIVATIALGMGIDKQNVRNVIHYGPSKTISSYYEEVGRAGRNGQPARCILLYQRCDFSYKKEIDAHIFDGFGNVLLCEEAKMEEYIFTPTCRRKYILYNFNNEAYFMTEPRLNCCDNCTSRLSTLTLQNTNTETEPDVTVESEYLCHISSSSINCSVESKNVLEERMTLYRKLVDVRNQIARDNNCSVSNVASNVALMQIARYKPRSLIDLKTLHYDGMHASRIELYGEEFLKTVDPDIRVSNLNVSLRETTIKEILTRHPLQNSVINPIIDNVCNFFMSSNLSVEQIAEKRNLKLESVMSFLIYGIKAGYPIKLGRLGVSRDNLDDIIRSFRCSRQDFSKINVCVIKQGCTFDISTGQVLAALAYLQVRRHLDNIGLPYEECEDFQFREPPDESDKRLELLIKFGNELLETENFFDSAISEDEIKEEYSD